MRRKRILCVAVALLVAATYVLAQGRDAPAPFRAVVTVELRMGKGKASDKSLEMPLLTEALNNLAAEGYEIHSLTPWTGGRILVVGRKR